MKKQMHLASQYLAAAGISFLDKREDDSHTNLGFNTESGCLESHYLSDNKDQLSLSYQNFSLHWKSEKDKVSFSLDGASHKEVLQWLNATSQKYINKPFVYDFHYDLPYEVNDAYVYKLTSASELRELMHLRILSQFSLEKINKELSFNTEIRIWPHHFDTGLYAEVPGTSISVGLGLAIPDTVCNEHYLYASGYNASGQIDTSKFSKLDNGSWSPDGFNGAILPASNLVESEGVEFFNQAVSQFKNNN